MNLRLAAAGLLPLTLASGGGAHQLDEYLQAATLSIARGSAHLQMRLTPGIAVFDKVMAKIDLDHDGHISPGEEKEYVKRFQRDLSLQSDGHPLTLSLVSDHFPSVAELKQGFGVIQLEFVAALPKAEGHRTLIFDNRHQLLIANYLVNCLVPQDPALTVTGQKRNVIQSHYQLDYTQMG